MTRKEMLEIFGQDTGGWGFRSVMCDGCDAEGVMLYSYTGSYLCQDCCDEQADEDGLDELMEG